MADSLCQTSGLASLRPSNTMDDERVTLQVGERRFTTLRGTLVTESTYFAARLSGRWHDSNEDGSYFIDADPGIFEHILRYLRNGNFPVFFDLKTQMLDHAKYLALLSDARYFGIQRLVEWIEKKRYLEIVQIETSIALRDIDLPTDGHLIKATAPGSRMEISTTWGTKQVYLCPRGIRDHRGDKNKCIQETRCRQITYVEADKFETEPILQAVIIETKVSFKTDACVDG
ncbi:BTB/POZ protein [Hypomontagnella submonticulosa]|nr:BTB/POZ protein [Hypomontagnella submonticulosa]